ncbi:chemotaxis protein CheW [Methylophilus aquaticus]|uniref:Chemotaxis protein CheW n=1 Tax=Methylophilus aquaticus TaxID=1971610 RepID=A0ABT9JW87_9PROT|nr:chemotaxis protein CheW [Methylophilus aquaticus]MDP8568857.1 chemotaxis protein CheW [Methylophilus aquaticus]
MYKQPLTEELASHFKKVNDFRARIYQLQNAWDSLALLAQLSGTGSEMEHTRSAFNTISNDVLHHLSNETLHKTAAQLSSKAFVIINLLVRNLFERTADIGFFATDDDVRDFLQHHAAGALEARHTDNIAIRFQEYQKKYTVYENIVLFDAQGKLIHQLESDQTTLDDQHPIVALAQQSDAPYIERFYETEINGRTYKSLVYAHTVRSRDGRTVLGVLCLCFKFVNELDTIFRNLISHDDWAIGVLLDEQRHVIASSDAYQIPLGATLCAEPAQDWFICRFSGREYLCVTKQSEGYQGYLGPGWLGQAMIPLEQAFNHTMREVVEHIDPDVLRKVMRSPLIFSDSLLNIPKQAASIQSKLNQSVWNGNIWQSNYVDTQQKNFSKTLLCEISNTGHKTQQIIEQMVSELYQTVVSVMLENSSFYAQLAVDIMDRNLYERANDVRWWALTYSFRALLGQNHLSVDDKKKVSSILGYINSLYTVYDNLIVFDRKGEVIAVSNHRYEALVGTPLQEEWVGRTRSCQSTQDYVVSRFEQTALYEGKHTYVYAAPVRHLDGNSIVGGIAIVFDSAPQFEAMLKDVVPKDGDNLPVAGSFTVFVSEQSHVIASSRRDIVVGNSFELMPAIGKLQEGEQLFDIAVDQNTYYAVGAHAAYGYREYKGPQDSYRNKVVAMIFTPLGKVDEINQRISAESQIIHNKFNPNLFLEYGQETQEYATFYVGNTWMGIETRHVLEVCDEGQLRTLPAAAPFIAGMHAYRDEVIPVIDLARMLGHAHYFTDYRQMIVIEDKARNLKFGLFVSALGEIPYLSQSQIQPMHSLFKGGSHNPGIAIANIAQADAHHSMLTLVTAESLWQKAVARHAVQADALAVS